LIENVNFQSVRRRHFAEKACFSAHSTRLSVCALYVGADAGESRLKAERSNIRRAAVFAKLGHGAATIHLWGVVGRKIGPGALCL
jgi:hypothetical protein